MSTTTSISAFSMMATTPQVKSIQPQSGGAQPSSFEQMIGSLTSGISAGIKLDGSDDTKMDAKRLSNDASNDFMSKLLAALQMLQETSDTPPPRKHHHIPPVEQAAAATQQTTPAVDNAAPVAAASAAPAAVL